MQRKSEECWEVVLPCSVLPCAGTSAAGCIVVTERLKIKIVLGVIKKDPAKACAILHMRNSPRDLSELREMQTRLLNMLVKCLWQEG